MTTSINRLYTLNTALATCRDAPLLVSTLKQVEAIPGLSIFPVVKIESILNKFRVDGDHVHFVHPPRRESLAIRFLALKAKHILQKEIVRLFANEMHNLSYSPLATVCIYKCSELIKHTPAFQRFVTIPGAPSPDTRLFDFAFIDGVREFSTLSLSRQRLFNSVIELRGQLLEEDRPWIDSTLLPLLHSVRPQDMLQPLHLLGDRLNSVLSLSRKELQDFINAALGGLRSMLDRKLGYITHRLQEKYGGLRAHLRPNHSMKNALCNPVHVLFILVNNPDFVKIHSNFLQEGKIVEASKNTKQKHAKNLYLCRQSNPLRRLTGDALMASMKNFASSFDNLVQFAQNLHFAFQDEPEYWTVTTVKEAFLELERTLDEVFLPLQKGARFFQYIDLAIQITPFSTLEERWTNRPEKQRGILSFWEAQIAQLRSQLEDRTQTIPVLKKIQEVHKTHPILRQFYEFGKFTAHEIDLLHQEMRIAFKLYVPALSQGHFILKSPQNTQAPPDDGVPEIYETKGGQIESEEPTTTSPPSTREPAPFSPDASLDLLSKMLSSAYTDLRVRFNTNQEAATCLDNALFHTRNVLTLFARMDQTCLQERNQWLQIAALLVTESSLAVEQLLSAYGFFHATITKDDLRHDLLWLKGQSQRHLPPTSSRELDWLTSSRSGEVVCRTLTECAYTDDRQPLGHAKGLLAMAYHYAHSGDQVKAHQLLDAISAYMQGFLSNTTAFLRSRNLSVESTRAQLFHHLQRERSPIVRESSATPFATSARRHLESIAKTLALLGGTADMQRDFAEHLDNLQRNHLARLEAEVARHAHLDPREMVLHNASILQSAQWIAEYFLEILLIQHNSERPLRDFAHDLEQMVTELGISLKSLPKKTHAFVKASKEMLHMTRYLLATEISDRKTSPIERMLRTSMRMGAGELPATEMEGGFEAPDSKQKKRLEQVEQELLKTLEALDLFLASMMKATTR